MAAYLVAQDLGAPHLNLQAAPTPVSKCSTTRAKVGPSLFGVKDGFVTLAKKVYNDDSGLQNHQLTRKLMKMIFFHPIGQNRRLIL